jgi:hypothetical protein
VINSAGAAPDWPTSANHQRRDEAKLVAEKACGRLIVGQGQIGSVPLSPEGQTYFTKKKL